MAATNTESDGATYWTVGGGGGGDVGGGAVGGGPESSPPPLSEPPPPQLTSARQATSPQTGPILVLNAASPFDIRRRRSYKRREPPPVCAYRTILFGLRICSARYRRCSPASWRAGSAFCSLPGRRA